MKKRLFTVLTAITVSLSTVACGSASKSINYYEPAMTETGATEDYFCESANNGYYLTEPCADGDLAFIKEEETYDVIKESGFKSVSLSPLSTFGADVDTASYTNMRRFVRLGYGLDDFSNIAIRAEEFINYFKYDYEDPKGDDRFGVTSTISDCPWNKESKLLMLGVNTKDLNEEKKPDSNIVFLVDVSGSMEDDDKLPLLKDSMKLLVETLSKNDRVSIVTYANGTKLVLDGVTCDSRRKINKAFDSLMAGGGTNGEGGIELAYEVAKKHFIEGGNNRVIIATDGDFNIGKHRGNELEDLISEKKETGVFLSVLGFGTGNYNDVTGETLADKGNGNYSYIDCIEEAKRVLVDEFSSTIYTVAKDTKLQVEFNPAMVSDYRLIGYENRALAAEDFKDDTKDGGEVGAGHQVTVLYELKLAESNSDSDLKYQETTISDKGLSKDEWCTLSIAYKDPDKETSDYLEFPIGANDYTNKPDDNFILASSVAEYAMALNNSSFLGDLSKEEAINQAIENVKKLDSNDERVTEFIGIMNDVLNTSYDFWYE
jgi:Ca-activated chloride channel family protein